MIVKNIDFKINNNEKPYEFKGTAKIYKDIISFNDNEYIYLFDIKAERLVKSNNKDTVTIDLKNEKITINNEHELIIKIDIVKKYITNDKIIIIYKINDNLIEIDIEIKEV